MIARRLKHILTITILSLALTCADAVAQNVVTDTQHSTRMRTGKKRAANKNRRQVKTKTSTKSAREEARQAARSHDEEQQVIISDASSAAEAARYTEATAGVSSGDIDGPYESEDKVYESVDQMPEFPGGVPALMKYLRSHLRYPEECYERDIQGKVVVRFVVNRTGDVNAVEVVKSVHPQLDNEAIRVCKSLPKFEPGRLNSRPVSVWYTLPVNFMITKT